MAALDRRGSFVYDAAIKTPVLLATTVADGNIALAGLLTIDSVVTAADDRVLVQHQTDATENGIYSVSTGNWTRTTDADGNTDFVLGTLVYAVLGSVNAGLMFSQTCDDEPVVIGTSEVGFTEQSNVATAQLSSTSTSSLAIGAGSKTFATQTGKSFAAGQWVLAYSRANHTNAMLCQITSYTAGSLVTSSVATGGSGTITDWTIVLTNSAAAAGLMPPVGTGNTTGASSSTTGHLATFADATGKVLADGGAAGALANLDTLSAKYLANSAAAFAVPMINGTIVESHAGNAVTIAIKTLAGADPSAADPVWFLFRNATVGTGDFVPIKVTAALSVTIPSGATMGFSNATAGRIWLEAINNAGAVELAVVNCRNGGSIYPLHGWGIVTTTVLDTSSDNAAVPYSASARASVAHRVLGYLTWETGLTTAGTWDASPTRIQLAGYGVPLPGSLIQSQLTATATVATGTTTIPEDNTIPQNTEGDQYMTQAITPTSAANLLKIEAQGVFGLSASVDFTMTLIQDSIANALCAVENYPSNSARPVLIRLLHTMLAGTAIATTFKARAGGGTAATITFNGTGGVQEMGGVMNSFMSASEFMA